MTRILKILVALTLSACATLPGQEPVQVTVADIESMEGEGMEMRMLVKLRVQNPNDSPVEYDGVFIRVEVLDRTLGTGVSDQRGSVPRYGEAVIGVPVTVSVLRVALNVFRMLDGKGVEQVHYKLTGKLDGPTFGSTRFESQGDLMLPD